MPEGNKETTEVDRVRHILKGIGQFTCTALAFQNTATILRVTTTSHHLDTLQSIRLQQDAVTWHVSHEDLRALIQELIREELNGMPLCMLLLPLTTRLNPTSERSLTKSSW